MTVLTILGVLLGLGLVGGSCYAVHEYAEREYHVEVFSLRHLGIMAVPFLLFLGAFYFKDPEVPILDAIRQGNLDFILMVALAGLSLVGFIWYLAYETNIWIALFVAAILLVAVVIVILVLFLIAAAKSDTKKR